ncbi:MAG TPA: hypothetical protein VI454_10510 [Verrucomicrobiae bacterium]|jgi:hypothetical protein
MKPLSRSLLVATIAAAFLTVVNTNAQVSASTSTTTKTVTDGKTNGLTIRQATVNGQPVQFDVQVLGDDADADLGKRIAEQVRAATAQALAAAGQAKDAAEAAARGFSLHLEGDDGQWSWEWPPRKGSSAVIVASKPPTAKIRAEWEEDLNVMGRLLEKAATQTHDGGKQRAMGIKLMTFGEGNPLSRLYLEGHGALLQINVGFPLVEPPKKKVSTQSNAAPDSVWDKARREIYGGKSAPHYDSPLFLETFDTVRRAREFAAERVEKLTQALVETLKEASHLRHLKPDESITVVVTGPGSTLTLTAKKSAADDFAKGKLDADAFRKKVTVTSY